MFQSLLDKLARPRHEFIPSLSPFPTPDASSIATSLNVRSKAAQDGARDYPATESDQPTSTELDVHNRFREIVRQAEQVLSDQWNAYSSRIRSSTIDQADVAEALADGRRALERAREQVRSAQSVLASLQEEKAEAEREFTQFRVRNGLLHRMPSYPSTGGKRALIAALVVMFLFESIVNGFFFAKGSERGIVGGVGAALLLSALNLGIGFVSGFLAWRGACGRGARRLAGMMGILAWLLLSGALNFFIACYRDIYAMSGEGVSLTGTLERMRLGLGGLSDAESLILLVLGIALNLLAALEGFNFDDRFPEYGATDRRRREVNRRLEDAVQDQVEQNAGLKEEAFDAIGAALKTVKERSEEKARAELGRRELVQAYTRHKENVQAAFEAVLRSYWEENERARATPGPARFQGAPPKLSWLEAPTADVVSSSTSTGVQELETGLERLMSEWNELGLELDGKSEVARKFEAKQG